MIFGEVRSVSAWHGEAVGASRVLVGSGLAGFVEAGKVGDGLIGKVC